MERPADFESILDDYPVKLDNFEGPLDLLLFLIRRGAASHVASLFFLVPPVTALIAWAMFGEVLGPLEIAGVAVAAIGVLMVNRPGLFTRPA